VSIEDVARAALEQFLGIDWPDGDPGRCRVASGDWAQLAAEINAIAVRAEAARAAIAQSGSAPSLEAFDRYATVLTRYLARLAAECREMTATALDEYAAQLETTRHQLIVIGEQVAAEIAVTVVYGFITAGLSSLATSAVLAVAGVESMEALSGLALAVARVAALLAYYVPDAIVYGTMDQGSQALVLAANGDPMGSLSSNLKTGFQIGVANAAWDGSVDSQLAVLTRLRALAVARPGVVARVVGKINKDVAGRSVPARALARFTGSALVYTPTLKTEQGHDDVLPSDAALEQKAAIHFGGRVGVDIFRFRGG
jgi:hypothetical protein